MTNTNKHTRVIKEEDVNRWLHLGSLICIPMIWFDRNIIIIIEKKQSYIDCGYHLMFSYTWERVWSMCVWVCAAVFACMHLCMTECLSNFYGDKLVKNWTGVLGQPTLHSPHSPTGSPAATTYQEGRAEQMLPSSMTTPKTPCPAGLLCELQAWLRPDWTVTTLSQAHVYEQIHKI